jgi:hypothetical protein
LKIITMADIRDKRPCYSPLKYAGENWSGTILNVLRDPRVPAEDKIWLATRRNMLSDKTARLFAVWCAREAIKVSGWGDPRSLKAIEVAEAFAHGKAAKTELAAAYAAAAAADAAAYAAAYAAAAAAYAAAAAAAAYAAAAAAAADAAAAAADAADAKVTSRKSQVKQLIKLVAEHEQ